MRVEIDMAKNRRIPEGLRRVGCRGRRREAGGQEIRGRALMRRMKTGW